MRQTAILCVLIDTKSYLPLMLTWTGLAQDPIAALAGVSASAAAGAVTGAGSSWREPRQISHSSGAKVVSADELAKPTTLRMYCPNTRP